VFPRSRVSTCSPRDVFGKRVESRDNLRLVWFACEDSRRLSSYLNTNLALKSAVRFSRAAPGQVPVTSAWMCTCPIACCLCEDDPCTVDGEEKWEQFSPLWRWINESVCNVCCRILTHPCLCVLEKQTSVPSSPENSCLFPTACHYEELWIFWVKSQCERHWGASLSTLQYRCPLCTQHGHLCWNIAAGLLSFCQELCLNRCQHRTLLYLTQKITLCDLTCCCGFSRKISSCSDAMSYATGDPSPAAIPG